ncbi:hypothetical protein IMZ48_37685 [Candidatus Bathyarchaeota archaeon]|nr:hypothetical protein [Candidatus Bathyarchaeota archaeon]
MFEGSFSYDSKGLGYCWPAETPSKKRQAEAHIEEWNEELEPEFKALWSIDNPMRRLRLRNIPMKAPEWRWNQKNGKLIRKAKGGIDWYRYQQHIMLLRLIPFAKECQQQRPDTLVQEDNAPAHAHWYQGRIYDAHGLTSALAWQFT